MFHNLRFHSERHYQLRSMLSAFFISAAYIHMHFRLDFIMEANTTSTAKDPFYMFIGGLVTDACFWFACFFAGPTVVQLGVFFSSDCLWYKSHFLCFIKGVDLL